MYQIEVGFSTTYTVEKLLEDIFWAVNELKSSYYSFELMRGVFDSLLSEECLCGCSSSRLFLISQKLEGVSYFFGSYAADIESVQDKLALDLERLERLLSDRGIV